MTEIGGNVPNPLPNLGLWEDYLIYWIEASRNLYENAIRTNEQWLKTLRDTWFKVGNPTQRETLKVE